MVEVPRLRIESFRLDRPWDNERQIRRETLRFFDKQLDLLFPDWTHLPLGNCDFIYYVYADEKRFVALTYDNFWLTWNLKMGYWDSRPEKITSGTLWET